MVRIAAVAMMVLMLGMLALSVVDSGIAYAQADTPTPTITPTATPDWTLQLELSSGQPARVVYEVTTGDYVVGILAFVQAVLLALILYTLQRNRLQDG